MKGTAQRTENWIMADTPGPVDMSLRIIAKIMAMDIGMETSQNNRHPLNTLLLSSSFSAAPPSTCVLDPV